MHSASKPIYLDYHATTPVDQRVLEEMLPWFKERFGNAASRSHRFGWQADEAVELARQRVADLLHTDAKDILFTSGSTEGLNLCIKGIADASNQIGKHIITVATEHPAVLDPVRWMQRKGYEVTILPVDSNGLVDLDQLSIAVRKDTIMVVVMWANNETGVIQNMQEIGMICNQSGVPLICDATQAAGKIDIDPGKYGVDLLSISAHKFYGPKGVGALYFNQSHLRVKPTPLIHGGGHEQGFRSGTLNVPGIVGMGKAAELRMLEMATDTIRMEKLRDQFEKSVLNHLEEVTVNGGSAKRLPTVSNIKVRFVDSQSVMTRFRDQLAISSGSACSSANPEPSHVLVAMGLGVDDAKGSFRISIGVPTTSEEMTMATEILIEAIRAERSQSPVWQMFKQGVDLS